ncbi:odorant receptor 67c-like [Diorhabda sublineata]|uniref:odorant receptor 67c-like n=1 Tax=Diorhabda sublineata TaxID=1163346 RepID=UPI0024E0A2F8|nr:odorant receptor 67c-like [Diorhabda sublineata]
MLEQHEVLRGIFGTVYRIAISSFIFVQVLIVIVQEEKTFLPLKSWTPFDLNTNSVYYPTVIFQLSIVGILILCDTSLDCLYYIVADVACCQLDILKENLREIDSRGDLNVEHELIMCIKYHQDIIRFVHQIEQVFSVPLFLEFFKSIVNICFVGFELTMVNFFSLHFLVRLIFLNGSLMQIFSFCWFGHALILKSSEVEDACYVIEWNECSLSEQKLILMIMMRAQKPLAVRALFLTLTMSTLTLILKTSYSYCTVLRTMYD